MILDENELGANNEIFAAFKKGKRVRYKRWGSGEFIFYCVSDGWIYNEEQQKQKESESAHFFGRFIVIPKTGKLYLV